MNGGTIAFRDDNVPVPFEAVLAGFRERGCNLLVTGEVSERVTADLSRRLLGAAEADRKRVLVSTDSDAEAMSTRLPDGVNAGESGVWLIDDGYKVRTVAKDQPTWSPSSGPTIGEELADLRSEIVTAITHFDAWADGLAPSELRLSVDSLTTPLERHDRSDVERFLRGTTAVVRGVRGMAHYHLPVADDADVVRELSPLFDARVELRQTARDVPEQRWYVPEYDRTTDWGRV